MSDVLDRATAALREEDETGDPGTLDRILATLEEERGDELVDRAAAALRYEAQDPADSAETLARIRSTLTAPRKQVFRIPAWAAAAVILLALGLAVPTAWALSTGQLKVWLGIQPAVPSVPSVLPVPSVPSPVTEHHRRPVAA